MASISNPSTDPQLMTLTHFRLKAAEKAFFAAVLSVRMVA